MMNRKLFFAVPFILTACGGPSAPPAPPPAPLPTIANAPKILDAGAIEEAPDAAAATAPQLATPGFVAKRQGTVHALAVDTRWVYWLTADGDVKRTQADGGAALKVASFGPNVLAFAVNAGNVYVAVVDAKGKSTTILEANAGLANKPEVIGKAAGLVPLLAADKSRVVWGTVEHGKVALTQKVTLFVLENGKKDAHRLPPIDTVAPGELTLQPSTAYFNDATKVIAVSLSTGKGATAVDLQGHVVHAYTIAGDKIFVAAEDQPNDYDHEAIFSAPLAGGDASIVAKDQPSPTAMVADGTSLYWVDRGTLKASYADGKIRKLVIATGAVTTLADNQAVPAQIALDDDNVYWANDNATANDFDSDVLKLAK